MMAKALLIIDYTYDSVADDGALTCGKPAQKLENSLVELADKFYRAGDYVIFQPMGIRGISSARNISYTPGTILLGRQDSYYMAS
jgi:hypothetical protein